MALPIEVSALAPLRLRYALALALMATVVAIDRIDRRRCRRRVEADFAIDSVAAAYERVYEGNLD